jgi:hypothetical protein
MGVSECPAFSMGQDFADEVGGPVGLGIVKEFIRFARFHDFTHVHEQDPVRHLSGKFQ